MANKEIDIRKQTFTGLQKGNSGSDNSQSTSEKKSFPVKPAGLTREMNTKNPDMTRYFNMNDPLNPIPLPIDDIVEKIKERSDELQHSAKQLMMDVMFLYDRYGYYKEKDPSLPSIKEFISTKLSIHRSHFFDILKGVKVLKEYFIFKEKGGVRRVDATEDFHSLKDHILKIFEPINKVGITKLRVIAQYPDDMKFSILESTMAENTTRQALKDRLAEIGKQNKAVSVNILEEIEKIDGIVKVDNDEIELKGSRVVQFKNIPEVMRLEIVKAIGKLVKKYKLQL